MTAQKRVVIIGGGFGGLAAAKRLAKADVQVTLVDRKNHHVFQPLLYQVATAGLNPADIAHPIRRALRSQKNCRVLLCDVDTIDTANQIVHHDHGHLDYDHLIVAAGATHAYFGNDHWAKFAPGLKSVEDAIEIRRRVLLAFEHAELESDQDKLRALLNFVVVGAGPTGVEMAGAIAEIATTVLRKDFRSIDPADATITLVEGADRVLGAFDEKLSAKALLQLEDLGVEVKLRSLVTDIDANQVVIKDLGSDASSTIETRTVIWAAGVAASKLGAVLAEQLVAETDRSGRIVVEPDLSLAGAPNIFVVGDLAAVTSAGKPVPGVAPAAAQAGRHAADMILAGLNDEARSDFKYVDKGSLATIGRSSAVAGFGKLKLSGFVAWVLWWAVHVMFLIDFRSRLYVMVGWAWQWLTFQRGARLITGDETGHEALSGAALTSET